MAKKDSYKETREKIVLQALSELDFCRDHKKEIINKRWHKNENMYYGRKEFDSSKQRAQVWLPKGQGFVDTLLAKVDEAPNIRFVKGEEADLKKERRLNALIAQDASPINGNWPMKDLLGKKQAIIYGRTIMEYHASSKGGYKSHLTLIDAYDFHIDPSAGGLDIEEADFLGREGIIKTKKQLQDGVESGLYDKKCVKDLVDGGGSGNNKLNANEQEKDNRWVALKSETQRVHDKDKSLYRLVEWYTTFDGERYYVLFNEDSGVAIRVVPLKEIFKSNLYPFVTWATNPDLVEFWTPSPMDGVREIFMAQMVSINQMLDNAEQRNKPMKAYNVNSIENPSLLKYRTDGLIPFKGNFNANSDLKVIETPEINTPITVYKILDQIANVESGVTADARGVSEEERVGILESNIAQVADRLGLLNKSYGNAYHRLGLLYYNGVKQHLNRKMAIQMIGIDGVEYEEVTKANIVPDEHDFNVTVMASNAEEQTDSRRKKELLMFLTQQVNNPLVNQKVVFRIGADIIGLSPDQVTELLSPEDADAELMSEAARDIQRILQGEVPEPNEAANAAYMQKLVDYLRDKGENMKENEMLVLIDYIEQIRPIMMRNMVKMGLEKAGEAAIGADDPGAVLPNQQPASERIAREQSE